MKKAILHLALIPAALYGAAVAKADSSPFFGHWINSENKPVYSSRGKLYKSIDIAACWQDFCGVSVADDGTCGPTLFRFLTIHTQEQMLEGHGKWGNEKLKIQIEQITDEKNRKALLIGLGDKDFDFEGREGSMPKYQGQYIAEGTAKCRADAGS